MKSESGFSFAIASQPFAEKIFPSFNSFTCSPCWHSHSNGFIGVINASYQQKIVTFNVLGPLMYLLDLTNLSLNSDIGVDAIGPEKNFTTTKKKT